MSLNFGIPRCAMDVLRTTVEHLISRRTDPRIGNFGPPQQGAAHSANQSLDWSDLSWKGELGEEQSFYVASPNNPSLATDL